MIMIHDICSRHSGHIQRQVHSDSHQSHAPATDHKVAVEDFHSKIDGPMMCLNERLLKDIAAVVTVMYLLPGAVGFLMWHISGIHASHIMTNSVLLSRFSV